MLRPITGEFDVRAYSAGKGIGGRVRKAQVLAAEEDYSFLREKLFAFRRRLHDRLAKVFPEKEASVMTDITAGGEGRTGCGGKGAVPEEWDRPYLKHFRAAYYFAGDGMLPVA